MMMNNQISKSFVLVLLHILIVTYCCGEDQKSVTKYDYFVKTPTSYLRTGGRITDRQIGYISQAGYKSILSVVEFTTNDTSYNGVDGAFPSSAYEVSLAGSYGMEAKFLVTSLTEESVHAVADIIDKMIKPIYVHCHVGYTATLFVELYSLVKGNVANSSSYIYSTGLDYGYNYQANAAVVDLVNSITGSDDVVTTESIEQTLAHGEASYKSFYWVHLSGHDDLWYNVGQILDTQIGAIRDAGYKSVVNFRDDGESTNRLPSDPSTGPVQNNEFSDSNGNYNSTAERLAVESQGMRYYYLPLTSGATITWTLEQYNLYRPAMKEAEKLGPVLSHCASGYRSAAYSIAYIAEKGDHCSDWALCEAGLIGLFYNNSDSSSTDKQVVAFFQQVLRC